MYAFFLPETENWEIWSYVVHTKCEKLEKKTAIAFCDWVQ